MVAGADLPNPPLPPLPSVQQSVRHRSLPLHPFLLPLLFPLVVFPALLISPRLRVIWAPRTSGLWPVFRALIGQLRLA